MIKEELSRVLKDARKSAGLTQKELARKIGLSQSDVSNIENMGGSRAIGLHVAEKWLSECGVDSVEISTNYHEKKILKKA